MDPVKPYLFQTTKITSVSVFAWKPRIRCADRNLGCSTFCNPKNPNTLVSIPILGIGF